jgi:hypothetical protein
MTTIAPSSGAQLEVLVDGRQIAALDLDSLSPWATYSFDIAPCIPRFASIAFQLTGSSSHTAQVELDNLAATPATTVPTVTINQASFQADPTNASPINFTVVFSEPVTDFATGDVTLGGTAGATTAVVTGSGTTYNVAVGGMTRSGTVIASIAAGTAHDAVGNPNVVSTTGDNSVVYVQGPAISNVVVTARTSADKTTITWSESDGNGFGKGKTTLTIDGKLVKVSKKAVGKTAANFSYSGQLMGGTHTFTIAGANAKGEVSSYSDTFTVAPTTPVISKVKPKAATSDKATSISWNVADIDGVGAVVLLIDGNVVASGIKVSGKNTSRTYTYAGLLSAGNHTYDITATDAAGAKAMPASGTFTVKATVPVIKNVKKTVGTSATATTITWTVNDYDGVGTVKLTIDDTEVSGVTKSGSDQSATFTYSGVLSAGKHAYMITAYDTTGMAAKPVKGSFTVKAPKNAVMQTAADVAGTVKTDWLIDCDAMSEPASDANTLDAVFATY